MKFKLAIKISDKIEGIFRLPCVGAIRKGIFGEVFYDLYGFVMHNGKNAVAREGDYLCEDYNNRWHVLTTLEYEQYKIEENGNQTSNFDVSQSKGA